MTLVSQLGTTDAGHTLPVCTSHQWHG